MGAPAPNLTRIVCPWSRLQLNGGLPGRNTPTSGKLALVPAPNADCSVSISGLNKTAILRTGSHATLKIPSGSGSGSSRDGGGSASAFDVPLARFRSAARSPAAMPTTRHLGVALCQLTGGQCWRGLRAVDRRTPKGCSAFSFFSVTQNLWQLQAQTDRCRAMKTTKSLKLLVGLVSTGLLALFACCSPTVPDRPDEACKNVAAGDLLVTEFMADPAGSDTGKQYIEIHNATDHTIDLSGLSLFQSMADGSRLKAIALRGGSITPHAYYVLSDTGDAIDARPSYVSYGYGNALGALRHESGRLGLRCGATVITEVTYTQTTAGHARELDGANIANAKASSDESFWCDATEPLGSLLPEGANFGNPGTSNPACPKSPANSPDAGASSSRPASSGGASSIMADAGTTSGQCFDALAGMRRALRKPGPGDLVVSEIMSAPSMGNNGSGEWFEVLARRDLDLNGLELANEGTGSTVLTSDTCMNVRAGDWLLLARSTDGAQNGGLPSPVATFDFTLADSGSSAYAERAVVLRVDGSQVDRATWSKSTKGASWQRSTSSLESGDNAACVLWCVSTADHTFGAGDRGTPGAPNTNCPVEIADAGSPQTNEPADTGVGGAPATVNTSSAKPIASGGATSGGAPASANVGGSKPVASGGVASAGTLVCAGAGTTIEGSGGATSGGAPATANTTSTEPSSTGGSTSMGTAGSASGGAPATATTTSAEPSSTGGTASGGASASTGGSSSHQCLEAIGVVRDPVAPQAGDLVITEVMSAPSQNNNGSGEWFEVLVNADIDLNGLELANEGTGSTLLDSQGCLNVRSGERLLFARSEVASDNGGLPFVTAVFDFTVADSSSSTHPERAIVLRHTSLEIARATWTKSTKGASWQLSAVAPEADAGSTSMDAGSDLGSWCVTPTGVTFGLGDRGTPGSDNAVCS
jgi:hypothetical protein